MEYFLYGMIAGIGITFVSLIITTLLLFKPQIKIKDEDVNLWEP
jgi:hypothetical protein